MQNKVTIHKEEYRELPDGLISFSYDPVTEFETKIAAFFGAPFGIATDSATHAIELCLRYFKAPYMYSPCRTYVSIPMLASKLGIELEWIDCHWKDQYSVYGLIFDAAVLWRANSYIPHTFMCISFQYQKHLSLGRGGMILCDSKEAAVGLKKLSYDGRLPGIPWREQNIDTIGYHYYMTNEIAQLGLDKLDKTIATKPRQWVITDWPDLTEMDVFKTINQTV